MEIENNLLGENKKYARYLGYFIVLYAAIFIFHDLLRLWGFGYGLQDLGIYHQVVWNTSQGRWFETSATIPFNEHTNWLGFHFDVFPILFTAVIYKIFPAVETMLLVHVSMVTLTSIIIYKICRKLDISSGTAFFWSVIYLINPFTVFHAMFSYQETSFSVFLCTLGFYFVVSRKFYWLLFTCFLLALTKEHHGITIFGFGLTWFFYTRNWRQSAVLCVFGIITAVLVILILMPNLGPYKEHFMFSNVADDGTFNRYSWLRLPFDQMLDLVPEIVFNPRNLTFIFVLAACFLLLPLGAIFFLFPVAGDFLVIILSNSVIPSALNFYYSAPFVPPCVVASAYVLKKISINHHKKALVIKSALFLSTFIFLGQPIYLAGSKFLFVMEHNMDWAIGKDYQEVVKMIPLDKVLMTDHQAGSNISNRTKITIFTPDDLDKADYVLLRISPFDFSPASKMQNSFGIQFATIMVKKSNWPIIYWKYPYVLFGKNYPHDPKIDGHDFVATVTKQIEAYNQIYSPKSKKKLKPIF